MPRRKPTTTEEQPEAQGFVEIPQEPVSKPKKVVTKVVKRPARRVSFEQWAKLRGIKDSHKGGLRAFVADSHVPRSYEAWDRVFKDY